MDRTKEYIRYKTKIKDECFIVMANDEVTVYGTGDWCNKIIVGRVYELCDAWFSLKMVGPTDLNWNGKQVIIFDGPINMRFSIVEVANGYKSSCIHLVPVDG